MVSVPFDFALEMAEYIRTQSGCKCNREFNDVDKTSKLLDQCDRCRLLAKWRVLAEA